MRQKLRPLRWKQDQLKHLVVWIVTLATAGSGLLNIYSVISRSVPERIRLVAEIFPLEFLHLSRLLTLLIGFTLIVSSINLYKRKRRALRLVIYLSLLSVLFHLTKGLDYEEAFVSLLLFVSLVATRGYFNVKSGPLNLRQVLLRMAIGALVVVCYGLAGYWVVHARWFIESVYLLTFAAIVYGGLAFFNPILYHLRTLPRERLQAARIIHQYGSSSLDFFKLWRDKSYYFNREENCFIAYCVANNCALALSDPTGPEEFVEETLRGFMEFCRLNDWGVALYQTPPEFLPLYHRLGLKHLKIGDSAIVDLTTFSLDDKRRKDLGKIVHKLERNGFHIVEHKPPLTAAVLNEARQVSDDWLSLPGRRERQFSLGMFDEKYLRLTPLYTLVDQSGRMMAFVNQIKSYRQGEATIDLMRHRQEAPNGSMDYLFTKLFLQCKQEGFESFSLGMVPLDGFSEREQPSIEERAVHYFIHRLNFIFSYSGLRHYKAKFADRWEPRYLLYQSVLTLPKVAIALAKVSEARWTT